MSNLFHHHITRLIRFQVRAKAAVHLESLSVPTRSRDDARLGRLESALAALNAQMKSLAGEVGRREALAADPEGAAEQRFAMALNAARWDCHCRGSGDCDCCRRDLAMPYIKTIFDEARRVHELEEQVVYTKSLGGGGAEVKALRAEIDAAKARHDDSWSRLCDPLTGIDPSHDLCTSRRCYAMAAAV